MEKQRVIVDTCIIIAAFEARCWNALCGHFSVETVERCVEECQAGDHHDPKRIKVASGELLKGLSKVHPVSAADLLKLRLEVEQLPGIDDGELHIMAWLHANRPVEASLLLSTTDIAAVRATHVLGLLDRLRSLQVLGKASGVDDKQLEKLDAHFQDPWLSSLRTRITLGVL